MALGAFLAGMVVGRSEYSLRAASEALPMRDAFAVLFFVSVGMLLDPRALMTSPALVLGALTIVLIAKPLIALRVGLRYPRAALTSDSLAQIGEFSFIQRDGAGAGRFLAKRPACSWPHPSSF
jgi:CPA2 family monovalent cation:H+ antiporter-2